MFRGITSMIFGYSDVATESETSGTNNDETTASKISLSTSNSSLEQTLNTATTKFTEQLMPQQASIEQLQSSNHLALPSLTEQLEERTAPSDEGQVNASIDDDDGDDCFNADSWELLDLDNSRQDSNDERVVDGVSEVKESTAVPKDDDDDDVARNATISKSSSGILKSSKVVLGNYQAESEVPKQQRLKPKVSFDTPDLVKNDTLIEKADEPLRSSKGKNKSKKNKQVKDEARRSDANEESAFVMMNSTMMVATETVEQSKPLVKSESKKSIQQGPVLNYAAALSMKPKSAVQSIATLKSFSSKVLNEQVSAAGSSKLAKQETSSVAGMQSSGAIKRNRPASSSSWSSSDECDANESTTIKDEVNNHDNSQVETVDDADEVESLCSSGFSDCDYSYGGLSDFIMKPKKSSSNKRNGKGSQIVSLTKRATKKSLTQTTGNKSNVEKRSQVSCGKSSSAPMVPSASKSSKPKRKRMTMSSSNSVDFLRNQTTPKPTMELDKLNQSTSRIIEGSSNDSSDIAEMDESWYVTPPPCFTGANKPQSGAKEIVAAQENALIEHPSIYIAGPSSKKNDPKRSGKQEPAKIDRPQISVKLPSKIAPKSKEEKEDDAWKSEDDECFNFDDQKSFDNSKNVKAVVEGEPFKVVVNNESKRQQHLGKNKTVRQPVTKQTGLKVNEKKAWKNKFIVDDWYLDDQEDLNSDFDDMFEPVRRKKSLKKSETKKRRHQTKHQMLHQQQVPTGKESFNQYKFDSANISSSGDDSNVENVIQPDYVESSTMTDEFPFDQVSPEEQENIQPSEDGLRRASSGKPLVRVKPIEPERKPAWQLRRQRSKRRSSLASSSASKTSERVSSKEKREMSGESGSNESSARSTPTLIDRIGSSIVTNLTSLTSGFVSSSVVGPATPSIGQMVVGPRSPVLTDEQIAEKNRQQQEQQQALVGRPSDTYNLIARKRMSKGLMMRQNVCAKQASSQRRPDRRARMFANQNGVSVNRKVHTNFH